MKVLDLYAGTGGFSQAFRAAGDDVFSIDNDAVHGTDAVLDISDTSAVMAALPWWPDVVLASPPCNSFSTGTMGRMWTPDGQPKHPTAVQGQRNIIATLRLLVLLAPLYWAIENPRGRLRSLELLAGFPRYTVWQCHLGKDQAKPTDLWLGGFPPMDASAMTCHNRRPDHPAGCCCHDHAAAPRGSYTGTQGMDSIEAAALPMELSSWLRQGIMDIGLLAAG